MRWKGRRKSSNVEDRRGKKTGIAGGGIGIVVVMLIVWLLGGNPLELLDNVQLDNSSTTTEYLGSEEENELAEFVSVVLAETESVWNNIFKQEGASYKLPKLVLYSGRVKSACGLSSAATGPFYCPGDQKIYIDLSFQNDLQNRFKAPGDFAMAYVIAHEVGHHVQNLAGITDQVMSLRSRLSESEFNKYMVRLELQADFYAGVWAHHTEKMSNILDEGDIEEALNAASAVGDDRIQKRMQGHVVPESFTHGTSEQRQRWFYKGFKTGDINKGDTFNASEL
ncbi:MAG: zinc metallopeptidase [Ignavibacteria bacterium]|nr:zinc metallopeptidase [Ignavibacteria bacterium]